MNKTTNGQIAGRSSCQQICSEISMKDFLDFLRTAYQVNEAIEGVPPDVQEKGDIDWKKLTHNETVLELQAKESFSPSKSSQKDLGGSSTNEEDGRSKVKEENKNNSESVTQTKRTAEQEKNKSDSQTKTVSRQTSVDRTQNKEPSDKLKERRSSTTTLYGNRRRGSLASKKDSSTESCQSFSSGNSGQRTAEKFLKKKLNEVLQEGILDSVLPYLLPKHTVSSHTKRLSNSTTELKRGNTIVTNDKQERTADQTGKDKKETRRKSTSSSDGGKPNKDVEVVIHVCDEVKNLRKDFRCSQKLLVSQMGYFSEVTTGQKLEDMDISVHCDITIFDWLIRWVRKEQTSEENWPTLDPNIVVPVLMSSAFLQMDALQEHCLAYCRQFINDIIRDSVNLTCLNDSILTRLAALFTNREVEGLKDRKDKLQSKLYCKLIVSLSEVKPDQARGHYSTLASLYKCCKCNKLILKSLSSKIHCLPTSMTMDRSGSVQSLHSRDSTWNLSEYVKDLKLELKTWRRVYWRLWSDCHLLPCDSCNTWFPPHQMGWCRFHTESPQFFTMENQRSMSFPIGRYPCCGERAYRFEILKNPTGCQYKDHVPLLKTERDEVVHKLWSDYKELMRQEPPALVFPERLTRIVSSSRDEASSTGSKSPCKELLWWEGLELAPAKPKQGLLTKIWENFLKKEEQKRPNSDSKSFCSHKSPLKRHLSIPQPQSDVSSNSDSSDHDSASSDGANSEESYHATVRVTAKPRGQPSTNAYNLHSNRNDGSRFWVSKLSTRCNQDNQREFEERAVRQMETILAKKTSGESLSSSLRTTANRPICQNYPAGGSYIKLEADWREAHCHNHGCPGSSSKTKLTYITSNPVTSSIKSKLRTQR